MTLPPSGTPVAIYVRTATTTTATAINNQIEVCRQFAQALDWVEVGAYIDAACSGSTVTDRDGLSRMVSAAERGEFSVLLVAQLDRISRNPVALRRTVVDLQAVGVQVCTVDQGMIDDIDLAFEAVRDWHHATSSGQSGDDDVARNRCSSQGADNAVVQRLYDMLTARLAAEISRLDHADDAGAPQKCRGASE